MRICFLCLLLCLVTVSCSDGEDALPGFVSGEGGVFEVSPEGAELDVVRFGASGDWYVYVDYGSVDDESWIMVEPSTGSAGEYVLNTVVGQNTAETVREADVFVRCSNNELRYTIKQFGTAPEKPVDIPEGGLDLIDFVKIERYGMDNQLTGRSVASFDYDEELRICASTIVTETGEMDDAAISYGIGLLSYEYSGKSRFTALLTDGLICVLNGIDAAYENGRLESFANFDFTWYDGNIISVQYGEKKAVIETNDKYLVTGNLYLDLMLVYDLLKQDSMPLTENIMVLFQKKFLGESSVSMPFSVTLGENQYIYICIG